MRPRKIATFLFVISPIVSRYCFLAVFPFLFRLKNRRRILSQRLRGFRPLPLPKSEEGANIAPMKKTLLSLSFALLPLAGCNQSIDNLEKVDLLYGTLVGMDEEISNTSHMQEITYPELSSFIAEERSFVLIVHSKLSFCSCYADWHDDVLAPYIKSHSLLVYWIDYAEFDGQDDLGLKLISNHETLGIFDEGELAYQKDNSDQDSDWVTSRSAFAEWMDARINYPKMLHLDKELLDYQLSSGSEFTLLYTLSGCPDCTYIETHALKEWFLDNPDASPLYVVDTAQKGIRLYENEDGELIAGSDDEDASKDEKKAYEQWIAFKADYGLSASSIEQPGYGEGFVPTIFHYDTTGGIDAAGVFYNDAIDEESWTLQDTYWTNDRLSQDYMTYLLDSGIEELMDDVAFEAPESPLSGAAAIREYKHALLSPYHDLYAKTLLDYCLSNSGRPSN